MGYAKEGCPNSSAHLPSGCFQSNDTRFGSTKSHPRGLAGTAEASTSGHNHCTEVERCRVKKVHLPERSEKGQQESNYGETDRDPSLVHRRGGTSGPRNASCAPQRGERAQ